MEINENAKKWIEALRSGRFKQTKGVLHDKAQDAYCCLGVACAIANENGEDITVVTTDRMTTYNGASTALPSAVKKWLQLRDISAAQSRLMDFNDDKRMTFAQIADEIEAAPEKYFNE